MVLVRMVKNVVQYLTEGFIEIFSPEHDSYPLVGIQPYSGTINSDSSKYW